MTDTNQLTSPEQQASIPPIMRNVLFRRILLASLTAFLLPLVGCADEGLCCPPNPSWEVTAAARQADVVAWGSWTQSGDGHITITTLQVLKGDVAVGETIVVGLGEVSVDKLREQDAFFLTGTGPYQLILAGQSLTPRGAAAAVAGDDPYVTAIADIEEVEAMLPYATAAAELTLAPAPDGTSGIVDEVRKTYAGEDVPAVGDKVTVPVGAAWDFGGDSNRGGVWLVLRTGPSTWEALLSVPYENRNSINWSLLEP